MGDFLSQAEIDALLRGAADEEEQSAPTASGLTEEEIDALGEIGNMSMGSSATTLFQLLGHKVTITTPEVTLVSWDDLGKDYSDSYVCVKVEYKTGLKGSNLMVLNERDVKVITDIMMGGDGTGDIAGLNDLHLSAISEAMNQMIGSAATSMSSVFSEKVDITPPNAVMFRFDQAGMELGGFSADEPLVKVSFKMEIGDLVDSNFMQLYKYSFAKDLVKKLLQTMQLEETPPTQASNPIPQPQPQQQPSGHMEAPPQMQQQPMMPDQQMPYPNMMPPYMGYPPGMMPPPMPYADPFMMAQMQNPKQNPINIQQAQFQSLDEEKMVFDKKNINLIMDVQLQVAVELGRTTKLIKEILEFGTGTVIELDKMTEEPVDILVNGKIIAKGEVVVVDEKFGVRITEIVHPSKRL